MIHLVRKSWRRFRALLRQLDNIEKLLLEQARQIEGLKKNHEFRGDTEKVALFEQLVRSDKNDWHALKSERVCLPSGGFSLPGFFGAFSMWPEELEMLSRFVGRGKTYLEIGSLAGTSAAYLAKAHPHVQVTCVDKFKEAHATQGGMKDVFSKNQALVADLNPIQLIEGDSAEVLPTLPDNAFDCILIDADHSYEAVYRDAVNAYRLVQPGGVLLFHDYAYVKETTDAVDAFRFEYGALPITERQTCLAAIRVPDPKDSAETLAKTLREKWNELPISRQGRERSSALLLKTDKELLALWNRHKKETSAYDVRGWYQEKYRARFEDKRVLDFGCGFSIDGVFFGKNGAKITFADITEDNLKLIKRISSLNRLTADTYFIDDFFRYSFSEPFDVVLCLGSLINAPFEYARKQVEALTPFIKKNGTVVFLGYPKARYEELRVKNQHEFASKTDGKGTPWVEWYDREKIERLFGDEFAVVFEKNFGKDEKEFNWFELKRL